MKNSGEKYLLFIFGLIGFVFLKSSYEKIAGGKFVAGLADSLTKFASKNPFPFYKSFLEGVAIPNAILFGYLTELGELFTGISLFFISIAILLNLKISKFVYLLLILGLLTGAFLNLTFWLAAGWTSSSTETVNFVMCGVQIIGLFYVLQKYNSK